MQISCQFASDFFEKRLHYCMTIALQKSGDKHANRRAAIDEKPTPDQLKRDAKCLYWYHMIRLGRSIGLRHCMHLVFA